MASDPNHGDGRKARRERSRRAVIDAIFALVAQGKVPPEVEQVAELSGVSVSSIFRMFDGLDDMRGQAIEEFGVRYAHLFAAVPETDAKRPERIQEFVRVRVALYTVAGPLMAMARHRAMDSETMATSAHGQRQLLAEQTQRFFAAEANDLTPANAANLVAMIDASTSPEAFEVLRSTHGRTRRQVERSWRQAVEALTASWCHTASPKPKVSQKETEL